MRSNGAPQRSRYGIRWRKTRITLIAPDSFPVDQLQGSDDITTGEWWEGWLVAPMWLHSLPHQIEIVTSSFEIRPLTIRFVVRRFVGFARETVSRGRAALLVRLHGQSGKWAPDRNATYRDDEPSPRATLKIFAGVNAFPPPSELAMLC